MAILYVGIVAMIDYNIEPCLPYKFFGYVHLYLLFIILSYISIQFYNNYKNDYYNIKLLKDIIFRNSIGW